MKILTPISVISLSAKDLWEINNLRNSAIQSEEIVFILRTW